MAFSEDMHDKRKDAILAVLEKIPDTARRTAEMPVDVTATTLKSLAETLATLPSS